MSRRITKQEEIDEILFDKIDKLRDKMDSDHDSRYSTIIITGTETLDWHRSIGSSIDSVTNPQAIKMIRPLLSSAESAIVRPVVASVNESR